MKDINDRTQELLAGFRESGYCTDCWAGPDDPHQEWCEEPEEG